MGREAGDKEGRPAAPAAGEARRPAIPKDFSLLPSSLNTFY